MFREISSELPGRCSSLGWHWGEEESEEDGKFIVDYGYSSLCPGEIAAIVLGSLLGTAIVGGTVASGGQCWGFGLRMPGIPDGDDGDYSMLA